MFHFNSTVDQVNWDRIQCHRPTSGLALTGQDHPEKVNTDVMP